MRNVYYLNKRIANDFILRDQRRAIHLVNAGLKVFQANTRPGVDVTHRLHQEGLSLLLPYLEKSPRLVKVALQDMASVLRGGNLKFGDDTVSEELRASLTRPGLKPGSFV